MRMIKAIPPPPSSSSSSSTTATTPSSQHGKRRDRLTKFRNGHSLRFQKNELKRKNNVTNGQPVTSATTTNTTTSASTASSGTRSISPHPLTMSHPSSSSSSITHAPKKTKKPSYYKSHHSYHNEQHAFHRSQSNIMMNTSMNSSNNYNVSTVTSTASVNNLAGNIIKQKQQKQQRRLHYGTNSSSKQSTSSTTSKFSSCSVFPSLPSSSNTSASASNKKDKNEVTDDFSYSNLHSMWLQRDKKQHVKLTPPTATTPIQLRAKSPIRKKISETGSASANLITSAKSQHYVSSPSSLSQPPPSSSSIQNNNSLQYKTNVEKQIKNSTDKSSSSVPSKQPFASSSASASASAPELASSNLNSESKNNDKSYEYDGINLFLSQTNANNYSFDNNYDDSIESDDDINVHFAFDTLNHQDMKSQTSNTNITTTTTPSATTLDTKPIASTSSTTAQNWKNTNEMNTTTTTATTANTTLESSFDPYDHFESMSTANSEVTVKMENRKSTNALISALLPPHTRRNHNNHHIQSHGHGHATGNRNSTYYNKSTLQRQEERRHSQQPMIFEEEIGDVGFEVSANNAVVEVLDNNKNDDDDDDDAIIPVDIPDSAFGISTTGNTNAQLSSSSLTLQSLELQQQQIANNMEINDYDDNQDDDFSTFNVYHSFLKYNDNSDKSELQPFPSKAMSDSGTDVFDGISSVAGPTAANSKVFAMDLFSSNKINTTNPKLRGAGQARHNFGESILRKKTQQNIDVNPVRQQERPTETASNSKFFATNLFSSKDSSRADNKDQVQVPQNVVENVIRKHDETPFFVRPIIEEENNENYDVKPLIETNNVSGNKKINEKGIHHEKKKSFSEYLPSFSTKNKVKSFSKRWRSSQSQQEKQYREIAASPSKQDIENSDPITSKENILGISGVISHHQSVKDEKENLDNHLRSLSSRHVGDDDNTKDKSDPFPTRDMAFGDNDFVPLEELIYPSATDTCHDVKAVAGWIPSVIRLFETRFARPSPNTSPFASNKSIGSKTESSNSPRSVFDPPENSNSSSHPTISDCLLHGIPILLLHLNHSFGSTIEDPSLLINNFEYEENVDKTFRKKLRHYNESKETMNGKCQHFREERKDMFENALYTHERVLTLLMSKQFQNAVEIYEEFFNHYGNHDFSIDDKVLEKQIIATFLYNMGVLYLIEKEYDLSVDFFTEGIATLKEITNRDKELGIHLNELSIAHYGNGDHQKSLEVFEDVLVNAMDVGNQNLIISSLNNIGSTRFTLGEVDKALESFGEALEVQRTFFINHFATQQRNNDNIDISIESSLNVMSNTLCNISYIYANMQDNSTASFFLDKAISIQKVIVTDVENSKSISKMKTLLSSCSGSVEL